MSKRFGWSIPEITEFLGSRRDQHHPNSLLDDDSFPLNPPEPNPKNKREEWGGVET